jgi:uncharacterized SAM-binding protein YcdF (DUF218 family)
LTPHPHPPAPHPRPLPSPRRRARTLAVSLLASASLALAFLLGIHPFLAVTAPVQARILVVEGWLPDYAVAEALREFQRHPYDRIYTTGGPLERGTYLTDHDSFADVAAATLRKLGAPHPAVIAVPTTERYRNRTYESAVALRNYLATHQLHPDAINLVTEGTHARRSRLCFRRALGRDVRVGVISIPNRDYDSNQWWRYSSGIKTILGESLAVLYAWLSIDYGD